VKNEHGLTPQQEKFARCVAEGKTQADALRACYKVAKWSAKSVHNEASRIANLPEVSMRIKALQAQIAERTVLNQADVRNALAAILRANPAKLILRDKEGRAKFYLPDEVDSETAAAVAAVEIDDLGRIKYKFWDKNSAAATAARMLGMFEKDNEQSRPTLNVGRVELVPLKPRAEDE